MRIERQLQGTLNTVFTELIKEKGLEERLQPYCSQEEHRADITLKTKNGKAIFFIELKDPTARDGKSVFDGNVVMREAERAQKIDLQYFGNCNFLACAFFDVKKFYDKVSINEGFFTLNDIARLGSNYSPGKDILNKLRNIAEFFLHRAIEIIDLKPIQFSELDELFIFKIRKLIEVFAPSISQKVWENYNKNKSFEKDILSYTRSQLWNKPTTYEEIENLTHISVLMLISKLIFYKTYVDNQTWHTLHPMQIGDEITTPNKLEKVIWNYFEEFREITGNFELLIGERSDIIFQIPFACEAIIELVKDVLDAGGHYNFGKIPFDIIGRIFEELIREDERHKLGQYFTPPYVIDIINAFAIQKSNDKVFDPSCGSGTFLVRAYERKKQLYEEEKKAQRHEILLNEIYGNDLSGYPAYLSMLNLAIRNTKKPSYPKISNKDFFAITADTKLALHNQDGSLEKKPLPKFDAIIGNPPYTRHEDIGTMQGTQTKDKIQALIKAECAFEPSQRTSIYGYFFYHATSFLKEDGYLAYVCQNSWLDTDYGIDLKNYLLRTFEIVAVMDSEVERFFPTASVNTTIVVLKRQRHHERRDNNVVKFVYFTASLNEVIKSYRSAVSLKDEILNCDESTGNTLLRINCVKQESLSQFSKWAQFLKAPKVYFDIIEKGKEKWTPLESQNGLAEVKYGTKTGNNDFFLLEAIASPKSDFLKAAVNNKDEFDTVKNVKAHGLRLVKNGFNEFWLIENEVLAPILTSPKNVNKYILNVSQLKQHLLMIRGSKIEVKNKYPFAFEYIKHGEKKGIHLGSSLANRSIWYDMGEKKLPDMSFGYMINDVGRTYLGKVLTNDNFQNIFVKKNRNTLFLFLNSTISWLFQQIIIRTNFGDGVGKIQSYEFADLPVPNVNLDHLDINLDETKNYKEELGTLESLRTVNPERLKLDSAILEAIGYHHKKEREDILLQIYRSTFQMIQARLQKAQSQKGLKTQRNKVAFRVYVEQLKVMLQENNVPARNTLKFAQHCSKLVSQITAEKKLQKKILDAYWKEKFGMLYNENDTAQKSQIKLF